MFERTLDFGAMDQLDMRLKPLCESLAMEKPSKLKTIGILQIVSGVLQIPISIFLFVFSGTIVGVCCGAITGGACCLAGGVGVVFFLLIPIGIVEVVSGILILVGDPPAKIFIMIASIAELVGLLLLGIPGAVVGGISLYFLTQDEEIQEYLGSGAEAPA